MVGNGAVGCGWEVGVEAAERGPEVDTPVGGAGPLVAVVEPGVSYFFGASVGFVEAGLFHFF